MGLMAYDDQGRPMLLPDYEGAGQRYVYDEDTGMLITTGWNLEYADLSIYQHAPEHAMTCHAALLPTLSPVCLAPQ